MFYKNILILILSITIGGCATKQVAFDSSSMRSALPSQSPEYRSELSVEEIEKLKPQLKFPIVLAVSQPPGSWSDGWSREEIKIIESWESPLKEHGFISSLVILPETHYHNCGYNSPFSCIVEETHKTAARFHADALLMVSPVTDWVEYVNPLSILNLTIVGMWIAPGHHRDAATIIEGILIDNRNKYLYAFARAEGEAKMVRPFMYAEYKPVLKESRINALKAFGEKMISQIISKPIPEASGS